MPNEKILAQVGLRTITDADVTEAILSLGPRGQDYDNPRGRQIMLEQIINKELVLMDARKNLYERDAEFKAELEKLKNELLANFYVEKLLRDVKVSEDEGKKFFEEHRDEFQGQETVEASHILVESEEKARDVKQKIQGGEMSFEEAAKAFSTCPSSQKGGDLGKFSRGQMVPEFEEAAFTQEIGTVGDVVQTQFGYHLILVRNKEEAKAPEYAQIREQIQQQVLAEKQRKAYESKMNQLRILYPVDRSGLL